MKKRELGIAVVGSGLDGSRCARKWRPSIRRLNFSPCRI